MTPADQLEKKLQELWTQMLPLMFRRVEIIRDALQHAKKGTLTEPLRAEALREAHNLAGSLGTFGMSEASQAAREIEDGFSGDKALDDADLRRFGEQLDYLENAARDPHFFRNRVSQA
jgi:HPt (histidine-containing phosphotransfer) domain-containing protein